MAVQTKNVSFPGFHTKILPAHLAEPDGDGKFPAIVVIHEVYGLNDNIREIAGRFAEQGYVALAVDLFAGRSRAVCMAQFMSGLLFNPQNHVGIHDLKASLDYLSKQPNVDPERIGAVGYCMGGSFAIAWAVTDKRLKAIAPYYAMNPRPKEALERLCPVVGSYPESDFTAGAGRKLNMLLTDHQIEHDIKIYPGAKHSFFNDHGAAYNAEAAQDSWARVLNFFQKTLVKASGG